MMELGELGTRRSSCWLIIVGECEADLDDQEAVDVDLEDSAVGGGSPMLGIGGGGSGIMITSGNSVSMEMRGQESMTELKELGELADLYVG